MEDADIRSKHIIKMHRVHISGQISLGKDYYPVGTLKRGDISTNKSAKP